jgi:hypothetical protein
VSKSLWEQRSDHTCSHTNTWFEVGTRNASKPILYPPSPFSLLYPPPSSTLPPAGTAWVLLTLETGRPGGRWDATPTRVPASDIHARS